LKNGPSSITTDVISTYTDKAKGKERSDSYTALFTQ